VTARIGISLLALGVVLAGAPSASVSAADPALVEWRKALQLYKQKKLDEACPLFESAAKAKQRHGAIWGDLGLCELKRGKIPESIHASQLAIRFGSPEVRRAAYFNLRLAEAKGLEFSDCARLESAPELGCKKPTFACKRDWMQYGSGMGTDGVVAFFDTDEARVKQRAEKYLQESTYEKTPEGALPLRKSERCFQWCARHPEFHCTDDCEEFDDLSCVIVSVDACHRRVGYVCDERVDATARARPSAGEFSFSEDESE
jgi:tetratricopeptide (TPR) repeat protein